MGRNYIIVVLGFPSPVPSPLPDRHPCAGTNSPLFYVRHGLAKFQLGSLGRSVLVCAIPQHLIVRMRGGQAHRRPAPLSTPAPTSTNPPLQLPNPWRGVELLTRSYQTPLVFFAGGVPCAPFSRCVSHLSSRRALGRRGPVDLLPLPPPPKRTAVGVNPSAPLPRQPWPAPPVYPQIARRWPPARLPARGPRRPRPAMPGLAMLHVRIEWSRHRPPLFPSRNPCCQGRLQFPHSTPRARWRSIAPDRLPVLRSPTQHVSAGARAMRRQPYPRRSARRRLYLPAVGACG